MTAKTSPELSLEIQAEFIRQEHRLFSVLKNAWDYSSVPDTDPRRDASRTALVFRVVKALLPGAAITGACVAAIFGVAMAWQANQLIKEQNELILRDIREQQKIAARDEERQKTEDSRETRKRFLDQIVTLQQLLAPADTFARRGVDPDPTLQLPIQPKITKSPAQRRFEKSYRTILLAETDRQLSCLEEIAIPEDEIYQLLARSAVELGEIEKAEKFLKKLSLTKDLNVASMVEFNSISAEFHFVDGDVSAARDCLKETVLELEAAYETNPDQRLIRELADLFLMWTDLENRFGNLEYAAERLNESRTVLQQMEVYYVGGCRSYFGLLADELCQNWNQKFPGVTPPPSIWSPQENAPTPFEIELLEGEDLIPPRPGPVPVPDEESSGGPD